ncbi:G-type lectin S-receptor-like serine/threonine-protein kinase LECRK3 [Tanacetum coccineum]
MVAVNKLIRLAEDGEKEFKTKVNAIARTHHKNLVQLLGYCDDGEQRLLVYEYTSNDTLASFLFGDERPSWEQRSHIALAFVDESESDEYWTYGCLVIEIVSCRKSLKEFGTGDEYGEIFTDLAWDCYQEGRLEVFVENDLEALDDYKKLRIFVMVGLWCIQENPSLRPTMKKVIQMLDEVVENNCIIAFLAMKHECMSGWTCNIRKYLNSGKHHFAMQRVQYHILSTLFLPFLVIAQQTKVSISIGASLTATPNGKPWLSSSGEFAFGFQQVQGRDNFLLSIWYDKIPDKTIIWYPEGGPTVPTGSKVELTDGRGLVLSDPQSRDVWSTGPTSDITYGVFIGKHVHF